MHLREEKENMYLLTIKNPITNQQEELSLPLKDMQLEIRLKENGITSINDLNRVKQTS